MVHRKRNSSGYVLQLGIQIIGEIVKAASEEMLTDLRSLLKGETIEAYVDTSVVYPEIRKNASSVYSFLLMAGYLTVQSEKPLYDWNSICKVCIPNKEITILYEKEIRVKMEPIVSSSTAIVLQQALLSEDIDRFQNELQKFIISAVSYNDASTEGFYHGLLLGMSAIMNQYYEVASNREAGEGRYDIQLKPRTSRFPGFLIEVKAASAKLTDNADIEKCREKWGIIGLYS